MSYHRHDSTSSSDSGPDEETPEPPFAQGEHVGLLGNAADEKDTPTGPTPVVGVGASAGGVEARRTFFSNIPGESGMAFVVVPRLAPDFERNLAHILAQAIDVQITEASDGEEVKTNDVYVIPRTKPYHFERDPEAAAPQRPRHLDHRPVLPIPGERSGRKCRGHCTVRHRFRRNGAGRHKGAGWRYNGARPK